MMKCFCYCFCVYSALYNEKLSTMVDDKCGKTWEKQTLTAQITNLFRLKDEVLLSAMFLKVCGL